MSSIEGDTFRAFVNKQHPRRPAKTWMKAIQQKERKRLVHCISVCLAWDGCAI